MRGAGTPAIAMYDKSGAQVGGGGTGASALGPAELAALALVGGAARARRRRR